MSGTRFPTRHNWLLCTGCSHYFADAEIAEEDKRGQWCNGCYREWVATLDTMSSETGVSVTPGKARTP